MIRVLITGKNGFIGGALEALLASDERFYVETAGVRDGAWEKLDLSGFDCVVHCAGIAHVMNDASMDAQYDAVNHVLSARIGAKARAEGVKHFVYLSSMIVYGQAGKVGQFHMIHPDTPPAPVNAYGKSKLDAENALRALEDDTFRVAAVRPPMVYGKGCKGNYNTLAALARKLPVFPEFDNRRSMIYVENLAECLRQLILNGASGIFHPQDGEPRSVSEIVRAICAARSKRMHYSRLLGSLLPWFNCVGLVRRAFGDMAYAPQMSEFGFEYRVVPFREGIRRTEESEH